MNENSLKKDIAYSNMNENSLKKDVAYSNMNENSLKKDIAYSNMNENNQSNLYGFTEQPHKKQQSISLKLIIDRNFNDNLFKKLSVSNEEQNQIIKDSIDSERLDEKDLKAKQILKLTHIHLDRENITEIDNLVEYLGSNVTHIYLQHNLIKKIENLEFFINLKFLLLSNNQIKKVENLLCCVNLKMLDLSFNLIDSLDVKQLPKSLMFLDLRENDQLTGNENIWNDYSYKIQNYLVNLCILNGEELNDDEEEEDVDEEKNGSIEDRINEKTNEIESLQKQIIERSLERQQNDKTNLDKISLQRKSNLDEIKNSINRQLNVLKSRKNN